MTQADQVYAIDELTDVARRARIHILSAVANAKGGHVGGPYSAIDTLTALYFRTMNIRPEEPAWPDRDRFVLSKGHSSIALYTIMALRGYFPEAELHTFDAIDSRLQGHPDMTVLPGIDMSSGSLGLGFAGALGIALGAKAQGLPFHTYVMLGDGECNEGIVWEGAHVANRYALDNLTAIIDHNRLQQFGWRGETAAERITPYAGDQLADRWRAFGWNVMEMDGHDMTSIVDTLSAAREAKGDPVAVVAHTVKGKGVSYMEGDYSWHSRVPTSEEFEQAMRELDATPEEQL
ncbi:MAG: transketolase [Acidimicrobiia bacterium]